MGRFSHPAPLVRYISDIPESLTITLIALTHYGVLLYIIFRALITMAEKSSNPFENLDGPSPGASGDPPSPTNPPPSYSPVTTTQESSTIPHEPHTLQRKPIAIPAIEPSSNSPFLRAYPPVLRDHNLPHESFLAFLDQLNNDISTSPPLQVLDATGGVLKSVPLLFPLRWIGSTISGLANLGSRGVSKSRTDSAIGQANKDIFGPRGLKVEIAGLDALAHIAKIPILDSQGKINRQAPLFQQTLIHDESNNLDRQQQLIQNLQPWIAPLDLHILPWTAKSRLTRFNAALKKRNSPDHQDSESPRQAEAKEDDPAARKGLWLVIRDLGEVS